MEERRETDEELRDWFAADGWRPELTGELRAELDGRLDALDANPDAAVSWEEIERHARRER